MLSKQGSRQVIDLFAGPGGWDLAAKRVGLDPIGLEWDDAACATRRVVGLRTMQCDVAEVDFDSGWHETPIWGLIASPPCQAWSMAGKGGGQRDKEHVIACAMELAAGNDTRAEHRAQCEDERSLLVVEPLRWTLAFRPRWIALEQVPPVLELWTLFAQMLAQEGYSTWAGVLEAERYGVPQTRERAILMASLDGPVHPPRATHQRYVKGEPQRHDVTLEGEVLPWVSMAEALGWDGGRAYRLARGEGMLERHGDRRAVPDDEPAPVMTSKARTAEWVYDTRPSEKVKARSGGDDTGRRSADEPAPTMQSAGLAKGRDVWLEPAPTITTTRRSEDGLLIGRQLPEGEGKEVGGWKFRNGTQDNACVRDPDEPAGTLFFGHQLNSVGWFHDRPATTVAGDARIFPSERAQRNPDYKPGDPPQSQGNPNGSAVRVTQEQAAILQTFPPDYPWQGSRTKQFEQIGNAVPPMLAEAVLRALVPDAGEIAEAA